MQSITDKTPHSLKCIGKRTLSLFGSRHRTKVLLKPLWLRWMETKRPGVHLLVQLFQVTGGKYAVSAASKPEHDFFPPLSTPHWWGGRPKQSCLQEKHWSAGLLRLYIWNTRNVVEGSKAQQTEHGSTENNGSPKGKWDKMSLLLRGVMNQLFPSSNSLGELLSFVKHFVGRAQVSHGTELKDETRMHRHRIDDSLNQSWEENIIDGEETR